MRIHSLAFRGVGPYRDRQVIDFDRLGESGLYMINGPTGAGKTTIIDCICFALYGRLASDEADLSRMRSDFAQPSDPTEVDLVFETAAGVFRVIRTPEYVRAKARGTGETIAKATCRLFRLHPDGNEETIATAVSSADSELSSALGLTRAQFVQTVVLPQGQFTTFLYSDTKDRAEVLKRIFNTRLFERVAEILKEDAKAAGDAKAAATEGILAEIRQLAAILELEDAAVDPLLEHATNRLDDELTAGFEALSPAFVDALAATELKHTEAQKRAAAADTAREQAKEEATARAALDRATGELAEAFSAVEGARVPLSAGVNLATALEIAIDDSAVVDTWRGRASAAATSAGGLQALLPLENTVLAWPSEESEAKEGIEELRQRQADGKERLTELPKLLLEQQAIADARPPLDASTQLSQREQHLDAIQKQFAQLEATQAGLPALRTRAQEDLGAAKQLDAQAQAASHSYRAGIAADLALQLEPGQPCPVCGATDHPIPAQRTGEPVSFDDVELLRNDASKANSALTTSQMALRTGLEHIEQMTAAITMGREELTTAQSEVQGQQAELKERSAAADVAGVVIKTLRAETDQLTTQATQVATELASQAAALATRAAAMLEADQQVAMARGSFGSVQERVDAIRALERGISALADRLATLEKARAAHADVEAALAGMPQRDGFGDVGAAQEAWAIADAERQTADRAFVEATSRLNQLRTGTAAIERQCLRRADQIAQNADLIELADLFAAGRGNDVGLHIYVLRSLFANVMECANRRFESLLNGRYRLVPAPESDGDKRSLQGLGVSVEDRLTRKVRPAKSLSGGETFCASLALALGLSDVVRMTAGGIEIGSLFIDEGFGSLDNDQLDEVMIMLSHLSSGGRRVGVISHVDSMKSAITERIDVTAAGENTPTALRVSWME